MRNQDSHLESDAEAETGVETENEGFQAPSALPPTAIGLGVDAHAKRTHRPHRPHRKKGESPAILLGGSCLL
jgi:hypothetical protein